MTASVIYGWRWRLRTRLKRGRFGEDYGRHRTALCLLKERSIKPYVVKRFQLSTDKEFEQKLKDVVGFHLDPPENRLVK